jgi:hypothetical protein
MTLGSTLGTKGEEVEGERAPLFLSRSCARHGHPLTVTAEAEAKYAHMHARTRIRKFLREELGTLRLRAA